MLGVMGGARVYASLVILVSALGPNFGLGLGLVPGLDNCTSISHPSLKGISRKIVTRELVYYILLGTPRSVQKCLWSNLTADFLGDNHLFLICDQMTHQILQLMGYLDSW